MAPWKPRLVFSRERERAPEPDSAVRFRELILPHLDAAYSFARYMTRDATAAEDIVQEAFLRAHRSFAGYRGGSAKAWLFAIVRHGVLDWARAKGVASAMLDEGTLPDIVDEAQPDPEAALMQQREVEAVRAVVEKLPEPFRETVVLRELEELSYKEIAVLMDVPIGTVMSRLARARSMLCALLQPELEEMRR